MKPESTFSSVVLPDAGSAGDDNVQARPHRAAQDLQHLRRQRCDGAADRRRSAAWLPKRRIESSGPSTASGGMTMLTREPSSRRASTMGDDSSMRRPTAETILSMMCIRCGLVLEDDVGLLKHAAPLHVDRLVGVHQDVVDGGILQQRLQRAQAEDLVQDCPAPAGRGPARSAECSAPR